MPGPAPSCCATTWLTTTGLKSENDAGQTPATYLSLWMQPKTKSFMTLNATSFASSGETASAPHRAVFLGNVISPAWLPRSRGNSSECTWCSESFATLPHLFWDCPSHHGETTKPTNYLQACFGWPERNAHEDESWKIFNHMPMWSLSCGWLVMAKAMLCRQALTTEVSLFGAGCDAMPWCSHLIVYPTSSIITTLFFPTKFRQEVRKFPSRLDCACSQGIQILVKCIVCPLLSSKKKTSRVKWTSISKTGCMHMWTPLLIQHGFLT